MDNASSLALLVAVLAGAVAYAAVSKAPPSSPSQQVIDVASNTAPTGSKRLPEPEAQPEPAIVIVHSRTPPAEKTVRPQPSLTGDPVHFVREVQRELRRVGCFTDRGSRPGAAREAAQAIEAFAAGGNAGESGRLKNSRPS